MGRSWIIVLCGILALSGCANRRTHVTAVPLSKWNQCEPEGIPYYLPKPLLVVAKNVRHIDESKVGLTKSAPIPNGFDNQASFADVKANVTVPGRGDTGLAAANAGAAGLTSAFDQNTANDLPDITEKMTPSGRQEDGIAPDSFYTYQIIFVPDLSQKYGLRIQGGPGEIRAAMNLVNGWMYTGMGPYYLKNSSTAQNIMASGVGSMFAGRGVADVLNEVSDLAQIGVGEKGEGERGAAPSPSQINKEFEELKLALQSQKKTPQVMCNYAEIYVYEPHLNEDGSTSWAMVAHHNFDRHYFEPSMDDGTKQIVQSLFENRLKMSQEQTKRIAAETEKIKAENAKNKSEPLPTPKKDDGKPERGGANPVLPGNPGNPKKNTQTKSVQNPSTSTSAQSATPAFSQNNQVNVNLPKTGAPERGKKKLFNFPKFSFGKKPEVITKTTRKIEELQTLPASNSDSNVRPGGSVRSQ